MPTLDVHNQSGKKVGTIELADTVFAAPVKEHLLWEAVVAQRAARRSGSANTKGRSEIRGSTAKVYRQKGTGRARHGSKRAPIFVGGGTVFGPKPRSYKINLPKKVKRGALRSALSLRVSENNFVVIKDLDFDEIKTKSVTSLLDSLGVSSGLLVDDKDNTNFALSTRNLAKSKYIAPEGINVYDILKYEKLVISENAVKQVEERLLSHE